jgi:hypothetical protein
MMQRRFTRGCHWSAPRQASGSVAVVTWSRTRGSCFSSTTDQRDAVHSIRAGPPRERLVSSGFDDRGDDTDAK